MHLDTSLASHLSYFIFLQFHHDLGFLLLSVSKEDKKCTATFQIVDQINLDLSLIEPSMRLDAAELNFRAGSTSLKLSDFSTATSYFTNATSLLPHNHWKSAYDFSIRLFFNRAKSAYSCGHAKEAIRYLKEILDKGHCFEDKLDAHHYYLNVS